MMRFRIKQQLSLTVAGLMAVFLLASCEPKPDAGISLSDPEALDRLIDSYVEADASRSFTPALKTNRVV